MRRGRFMEQTETLTLEKRKMYRGLIAILSADKFFFLKLGNSNEDSILMKNILFLVSIKPEIHTEENCVS